MKVRFNTCRVFDWRGACSLISACIFSGCIPLGCFALAADEGGDWVSLFDGKSLKGWHQVGDGEWFVEEGAIVGKTQEVAKLYGLLVSDTVYRDFTVRLKFKSLKGNSGFYIRMVLEKPDKAHGLQIEIDPRKNSGGIYESYRRAWISMPGTERVASYFNLDDWNDLEIAAYGGNVTVKVNGVTSAELKGDPSRPGGQLAMQMHAGNEMRVMFKDIEIRAVSKSGPDKTEPSTPEKIQPNAAGQIVLSARASRIDGNKLAYMPEWDAHGFWRDTDQVSWSLEQVKAGTYDVFMEWSVDPAQAGNPFVIEAGKHRLESRVDSSGAWDVYQIKKIGQIELEGGVQTIVLKPNGSFKTALMDLRELRLVPKNLLHD
jgi:hypothetical protein